MEDTMAGKLSVDVTAYEMPETEKLGRLIQALAVEDDDTGTETAGYGVYAVSSTRYAIMF